MKTVKEQVIDDIVLSMTNELDKNQLTMLLYSVSNILKDVVITVKESNTLPATQRYNGYLLIDQFISCKKLNGCTESTQKRYREVLKRFVCYIGEENILTTSTNDIRCFLSYCSKTMNNTSVDGFRLCINSFYAWMLSEEIIVKNPCVKISRIKDEIRIKEPVTQSEMVKLKDSCKNLRELVFIDLLDSCGLRCMEVPTIRIKDIDFNRHTMKVHGKGKKEREVILTDECVVHICQYLDERYNKNIINDYLICRTRNFNNNVPLHKGAISDMMRNIKSRAKVDNVKIHGIRRKFATDMNKRGMNIFSIQKLLGHASISTTQIYVNNAYDSIINEFNKYKN